MLRPHFHFRTFKQLSFFIPSCTSVLFSKLSWLLVNSVWSSVEASQVQGEENPCSCLMLKNMNTYQSDERGEETGEEIKRAGSLAFCRLAFTFQWKRLCASYVPGLMLPSAYSELAITSSFSLQIKDQSLNLLFSFSTTLWLKLPPASPDASNHLSRTKSEFLQKELQS